MKVIDLLNKIANGEEVPENIRLRGHYRCQLIYDYINKDYSVNDKYYAFKDLFSYLKPTEFLNDEVEVIEDKKIEKTIPEKIRWHEVNGVGEEDDAFYVDVNGKSQYVDSEYDSWEMTTILKINEIIDCLDKEK